MIFLPTGAKKDSDLSKGDLSQSLSDIIGFAKHLITHQIWATIRTKFDQNWLGLVKYSVKLARPGNPIWTLADGLRTGEALPPAISQPSVSEQKSRQIWVF